MFAHSALCRLPLPTRPAGFKVTLSTSNSGAHDGPPGDTSLPDGRSLRALRLHHDAQGTRSLEEVSAHLLSVIGQLRELTTKMEESVQKHVLLNRAFIPPPGVSSVSP